MVLLVYGPDWRQFCYDIWVKSMATSLTGVGVIWAGLSLIAALLSCSGFYLPYWIQVNIIYIISLSVFSLSVFMFFFKIDWIFAQFIGLRFDPLVAIIILIFYILYIK